MMIRLCYLHLFPSCSHGFLWKHIKYNDIVRQIRYAWPKKGHDLNSLFQTSSDAKSWNPGPSSMYQGMEIWARLWSPKCSENWETKMFQVLPTSRAAQNVTDFWAPGIKHDTTPLCTYCFDKRQAFWKDVDRSQQHREAIAKFWVKPRPT
jgi:hypothetical protein